MLIPPNATVAIFRATDLDPDGDTEDVNTTPLYTDIKAVIAYGSRTVQVPASGTPRQITTYRCMLPKGTDIQNDDRVQDQNTGTMYNVAGVNPLQDYGFPADVWVTLTLASG